VQAVSYGRAADAVLGYVSACKPVQEELQQILTQAAGFALLIMLRRGQAALCAGPLELARTHMREIAEQSRAILRPSGAAHHRHHLDCAVEMLTHTLETAARCLKPTAGEIERDLLSAQLRSATDHLRATALILPGFDWVDLAQSCCATHTPGVTFSCAEAA
jgi:hypothetical protein